MSPIWKYGLFVAAVVPLLAAGPAQAQVGRRPSRLAVLQQQNALQQQQIAVQAAVQQTTSLLQNASLQSGAPQPGVAQPLNFAQQQIALQIAVQQTNALLQATYRQNSGLSQMALRQLNTLQTAAQQTMSLQGGTQNNQLSPFQLQILFQEQTSLMGLLTSPPPPTPTRLFR